MPPAANPQCRKPVNPSRLFEDLPVSTSALAMMRKWVPAADSIIFVSSNIIDNMPDSLRQFKAEIFQALAHSTRIAILDQLREGELTVGTFVERLDLEQANLSQHLAVLRARQIVVTRKAGNQVFYSVRDPLIFKMLDLMRRYFQKQVGESMAMLEELEKAEVRR